MPATMTRYEFLSELIKCSNFKSIVEIGIGDGETAKHIASSCKLDSYHIIDIQDKPLIPGTRFVNLDSISASKLFFNESLDLVFIDADHSYNSVKSDIEAWLPKIRKGGVICGHDYGNPEHRSVERAVNETLGKINYEPDCLVWWKLKGD